MPADRPRTESPNAEAGRQAKASRHAMAVTLKCRSTLVVGRRKAAGDDYGWRYGCNRGNGSCRGAIVSMPCCPACGSVQTDPCVRWCGSAADKVGRATGRSPPQNGRRSRSQPVESRPPHNATAPRRVGANRSDDGLTFRCSSPSVLSAGNGGRHGGRLRAMCLR